MPMSDENKNKLRCNCKKIMFISFIFVLFISMSKLKQPAYICQQKTLSNRISSSLTRRRGPPYTAYIISYSDRRFNATLYDITTALPGFFNMSRKQAVSINDSRINRASDLGVSSLLLSHIDVWNEFGSKAASERCDDDWVFVFEDDVGVIPYEIIRNFHTQAYMSWNDTYPYPIVTSRSYIILRYKILGIICQRYAEFENSEYTV